MVGFRAQGLGRKVSENYPTVQVGACFLTGPINVVVILAPWADVHSIQPSCLDPFGNPSPNLHE